jgi:hypothetical protein
MVVDSPTRVTSDEVKEATVLRGTVPAARINPTSSYPYRSKKKEKNKIKKQNSNKP